MALKNTTGFERPLAGAAASLLLLAASGQASATLVDLGACTGANACNITNTPPNPVTQDPDDGILLAWDEVQNSTLAEDLAVDRVFDETASFIKEVSGELFIEAGTIVSSHYLQWDPGLGSATRVDTTISLDSQVFAFITDTQKLFDSDDALGLAGIDYNDFGLRGLESGDTTVFNGANVDISWSASSPGDWTRLITAFSPGGVGDNGDNQVPEPASFALVGLGLAGMGVSRKRAWKR